MEKNIETYYRTYQKKSDPKVLETYFELASKTEDDKLNTEQILDYNNRFTAIKKVVEERGLDLKKHTPKSIKKGKSDNPLLDGGKSIFIGVLVFAISLWLMDMYDGKKIFLIGAVFGAIKILEGIITMAVGFFFKMTNNP